MNQARMPSPALLVAAKARRRTAGIAISVALGALGAWARKVRAWVSYSAEKGRIKVFATKAKQKPRQPLFASNQDLVELFGGERAYAGFTAGSGSETAEHKVFSWFLEG